MADIPRDPVTGRFAKVDPVRDVLADQLGVPEKFAGGIRPRYAPAADELAQGGQSSPPGVRTARMTGAQQARYLVGDVGESAPGEVAATARYGVQGRHVRAAARRSSDPMDPSRHLTGAE